MGDTGVIQIGRGEKVCPMIQLGHKGENLYTRVSFDVSSWLRKYPGASVGLFNQQPGGGASYPIPPSCLEMQGNILIWTVTATDISERGQGKCELIAYRGDTVIKSAVFDTVVWDALDGSGDPPGPWESWQADLERMAVQVDAAARDAEDAATHGPRIVAGQWETWDSTRGKYIGTGVPASGTPGPQGPQGETGPQGAPGAGVPTGGTAGQVLSKASGTDYDTEWTTPEAGGVTDVQVNGTSVVQDGVANVPIADRTVAGAVKLANDYGIQRGTGGLSAYAIISPAGSSPIKDADTSARATYQPVTPRWQHESVFYGLAKAAGDTTQSQSSNPVGTYTDSAKSVIQTMLGISGIIAPIEGTTASKPYGIGDAFLHGGALYKATVAIAANDAIAPGTNCEQTTIVDMLKGA